MPSLATYPLHPPIDSKEYEKIIRDYCASSFGGNVYLFGRNGQCQYGVDIISSHNEKIIGVQCKDYNETKITEKDVDEMILLAESFEPQINLFVIAIAQKTDAKIQQYVLLQNRQRVAENKFPVQIIYWNEVESYIKSTPDIFHKYYGFLEGYQIERQEDTVLVTDINVLRKNFLELYCRNSIRDVILSDIFVGIPGIALENYTCYAAEMALLLERSCLLQETDMYQNIKSFQNKMVMFVDYLGTLVTMNGNGVCTIANQEIKEKQSDYNAIIEVLQKDIISTFLLASQLQEF